MAISKSAAGSPQYATFDHLIPKVEGGANAQSNLRLAHQSCNQLRSALPASHVVIAIAAIAE
jgi:5-methylcytosine-specific restriction endonuclease McrA